MTEPILCAVCGVQCYSSGKCRGCDRRRDPMERFMAFVVVEPSGCWRWTGSVMENGYGRFVGQTSRVGKRTVDLAHRWIYEQTEGPIPSGLQLDHVYERGCRLRSCVNPAHLEPVTNRENTMRGAVGRITHCPQNHPYDEANTFYEKDGHRRCKTCVYTRNRERQRALRASDRHLPVTS